MRWNAARSQVLGRLRRGGPILLAAGLAPAILLTGCDGDADGARETLAQIEESSYVTREPVTTTTTVPGETPVNEEGRSAVEQEYEVQSGDYPLRIAQLYDIPLEDLANYNDWTAPNYSEFPFPGTIIKIPPGALIAGAATESSVATVDSATAATTATTTAPTTGDGCVEGSHTIVEGDYPGKVAGQYDITVEQLDAANANTPGYSSFYVGLEIVIPC